MFRDHFISYIRGCPRFGWKANSAGQGRTEKRGRQVYINFIIPNAIIKQNLVYKLESKEFIDLQLVYVEVDTSEVKRPQGPVLSYKQ
jgi:hypothetical protein